METTSRFHYLCLAALPSIAVYQNVKLKLKNFNSIDVIRALCAVDTLSFDFIITHFCVINKCVQVHPESLNISLV